MDKIELVFNMYKNTTMSTREFKLKAKRKYKLTDKEISDIYVRINNYQVEKYGRRMYKSDEVIYLTKEECNKRARSIRTAKYYKKYDRGKNYEI